jgi:uncharacterized protein (TIGR02757 family)
VAARRRTRRPGDPALGPHLEALVRSTDAAARRELDPVGFVHRYARDEDREVVGLVAALLAFGNVVVIRRAVATVLDRLGPSPAAQLDASTEEGLRERLRGFVHRVWRGDDVARLLANAAALRRTHGSLGAALASMRRAAPSFLDAVASFAEALRGPNPGRGLAHLVPDPRKGSASKRLFLYLRWMIRRADGVDLGIFAGLDPAELIIPVDTHVQRIARNLRLTRRKDASLRTAREITEALAVIDPADPVRFDFALCHLGISKDCPSRRDEQKCARCVVRTVCRHWNRPDQ